MKSVIIIGGGLSGLAAAVDLSSSGYSVTLLEQRKHLGGRAYSFVDPESGDTIDNGQHLMLGCYHTTFKYLRTIGSYQKLTIEPDLHIRFRHPEKGIFDFDCPPFPAPFHLLAGLSRLKSISARDKHGILRVVPDLMFASDRRNRELENLTVDEWLTQRGQSETMKKYLWNLIVIATLNDSPKVLSARLFIEVLRDAFVRKRSNSSIVFSKVGLSELFIDDAIRFLTSHNARIITETDIDRIEVRDGWVTGIRSHSGVLFIGDIVISAVPYYELQTILQNSDLHKVTNTLEYALGQFTSSPILSIHLWFDREVMEERFAGLLDTHIHWVFNKSALSGKTPSAGQYLSLVISGAQEYVDLQKDVLIALALEELKSVFPETRSANLLHARVIKERRATFSARCGIDQYRPSSGTDIPNLFLAGDWTATGLPATIEGAIKSGYKAAEAVKSI
jgi:hydroxysqualene dehydroxylase